MLAPEEDFPAPAMRAEADLSFRPVAAAPEVISTGTLDFCLQCSRHFLSCRAVKKVQKQCKKRCEKGAKTVKKRCKIRSGRSHQSNNNSPFIREGFVGLCGGGMLRTSGGIGLRFGTAPATHADEVLLSSLARNGGFKIFNLTQTNKVPVRRRIGHGVYSRWGDSCKPR